MNSGEKELLEILNFDIKIFEEARKLFKEEIYKYENEAKNLVGFALKTSGNENLFETILELRKKINEKGYFVFISDTEFTFTGITLTEVAFIKNNDLYDIISKIGTEAPNFDLENQDIINKLKEWEKICSFEVLEIKDDTLSIFFNTLPENLEVFAEDIYKFCPDTLEQGYYGELDELEEFDEFDDMDKISDLMDNQTPATLATYLKNYNSVFLWWD
ncbi:MAG: DUF4253 domain-containing protein [Candidatus Sericytochromatia bacterium]